MPTDDFSSPGNKQYLTDFEASGADAGLNGDARSAYVAIDLVDFAAKSAATIDRAGILDALNGVGNALGVQLTPTLDFTKPGPNPAFPRMFNLSFFHATVKDGQFASAGDGFVPIFGSTVTNRSTLTFLAVRSAGSRGRRRLCDRRPRDDPGLPRFRSAQPGPRRAGVRGGGVVRPGQQ